MQTSLVRSFLLPLPLFSLFIWQSKSVMIIIVAKVLSSPSSQSPRCKKRCYRGQSLIDGCSRVKSQNRCPDCALASKSELKSSNCAQRCPPIPKQWPRLIPTVRVPGSRLDQRKVEKVPTPQMRCPTSKQWSRSTLGQNSKVKIYQCLGFFVIWGGLHY